MLVWQKEFSVGVDEMDNQHKKIIDLINRATEIKAAADNGAELNVNELKKVCQELVEYTKQHFAEEEDILKHHSYKELDKHKQVHKNLISRLDMLIEKLALDPAAVANILVEFLSKWLKEHILGIDMKYKNYVGQRAQPSVKIIKSS